MSKTFEIIYKAPEDLIPYAKNAKKHPEDQVDKLAGQIHSFGFDQPIVVDKSMVIIKGHGRLLAAKKLALKKVPIIVQDLDEYQAMAARIADNKVSSLEYDNQMMQFDLGTLQGHDFDMNLTGMDIGEIETLLVGSEVERETGKAIDDYAESHEETDIRQLILIMTQEDFDPMVESLMQLQADEGLENNTEAVKFLIEFYANNKKS